MASNIVLIVLDTVRKSSLSNVDTPTMDLLADEGVVYDHGVAPAPWTVPSHAGMFTGDHLFEHGTTGRNLSFDFDQRSLPAELNARGYRTVSISNNPFLTNNFGFDRGFETFFRNNNMLYQSGFNLNELQADSSAHRYIETVFRALNHNKPVHSVANAFHHIVAKTNDDGGDMTVRKFKRLFEATSGPVFGFLNLMEAHAEYWPPEPYRSRYLPDGIDTSEAQEVEQFHWDYLIGDEEPTERKKRILRSLYEGSIAYLDSLLNELVTFLERTDQLDETLLVVVGDHGESLGEQNEFGHVGSVSERLLHVPFITHPPGSVESESVSRPTSLKNVFDIVVKTADGDEGDINYRQFAEGPTFAEYTGFHDPGRIEKKYETDIEIRKQGRQVVYWNGYKYIRNKTTRDELYDLSSSIPEDKSLLDEEPEIASQGRALIQKHLCDFAVYERKSRGINSSVQRELKDLGYI